MPIPSTHISLLCDIRNGNCRDETWAAFHTRYHKVILGWFLYHGLPAECAEDLTQDVIVKLFQRLPTYCHDPVRGQFRSWLKTVVNNILIDFWRRCKRRPECDAVGGTAFLEYMDSLPNPDFAAGKLNSAIIDCTQTAGTEIFKRVRDKVKETTWQAFYQSIIDHRPAAEVAIALNLSVATVYKATYRVKQMLLEEYRHVHSSSDHPDLLSESTGTQEISV